MSAIKKKKKTTNPYVGFYKRVRAADYTAVFSIITGNLTSMNKQINSLRFVCVFTLRGYEIGRVVRSPSLVLLVIKFIGEKKKYEKRKTKSRTRVGGDFGRYCELLYIGCTRVIRFVH